MKKPYIILNAAMTLDGKIATKTGNTEISGQEDLIRVHNIRKNVDAIMVGIGTILSDNPRLTSYRVSSNKEDNPIRIVADNKARTPLNYKVLNDEAKTIIAVSNLCNEKNKNCDMDAVNRAKEISKKVEVFYSSKDYIDLKELMNYLYNKGIKSLLLEGGSELNFSMIKENLIDEIKVCIAPMIVGGKDAKNIFGGEGFDLMKDSVKLRLEKYYSLGKDFIMEYKVLK